MYSVSVSGPLLNYCSASKTEGLSASQRQVMREKGGETDQVRSSLCRCSGPCLVTRSRPGGWGDRRGEDWSVRLRPVSPPSRWGKSPVPLRCADRSNYTARARSPPGATHTYIHELLQNMPSVHLIPPHVKRQNDLD